jgi:hypothetical protein
VSVVRLLNTERSSIQGPGLQLPRQALKQAFPRLVLLYTAAGRSRHLTVVPHQRHLTEARRPLTKGSQVPPIKEAADTQGVVSARRMRRRTHRMAMTTATNQLNPSHFGALVCKRWATIHPTTLRQFKAAKGARTKAFQVNPTQKINCRRLLERGVKTNKRP